MKRYASHYLYLPKWGYLKTHVAEVEMGRVVNIFPLHEEMEDTEWLPGIIGLFPAETEEKEIQLKPERVLNTIPLSCLSEIRQTITNPYLFYPFDFTIMKPVAETQHTQLL